MGLLEWLFLILAAIILPPIIQAIFARRDFPEWTPECEIKRTLADRLADDRKAETLRSRAPGDVEQTIRRAVGEPEDDSSLHREDTVL